MAGPTGVPVTDPGSDYMRFIFGPGTENASLQDLQRRRAVALALAAKSKGYPKTLGEGMTYLGEAIGQNRLDQRLSAQEAAYNERLRSRASGPLLGGAGGTSVPTTSVPAGAAPSALMPGAAGIVSDASDPVSEQRDRIAALLRPEEVAQQNPMEGAPQQAPLGSQLASLSPLGTMSDAPPIGIPGRPSPLPPAQLGPMEENPPTPTSIAPMPTMLAQAGAGAPAGGGAVAIGPNQPPLPAVPSAAPVPTAADLAPPGVPGPNVPPTRMPPTPTVGRPTMEPRFTTPPLIPPQPDLGPTPYDIQARRLLLEFPGDANAAAYAKELTDQGDRIRKLRWDDYERQRKITDEEILKGQEFKRGERERELKMSKEEFDLQQAQLKAQRERATGGISDETWNKVLEASHKEVAKVPGAALQIENAREAAKKMLTGSTADIEQGWKKLGIAFGGSPKSAVEATETFKSYISGVTAAARQALVGGANISDKDLAAAETAAGANIKMERGSILKILDAAERLNTQMATAHQQRLATYSYGDPDRQRNAYGAYPLPMQNIVPVEAIRILRDATRDPARSAAVIKEFDDTFHTPGLAKKVLQGNRGL